MLMANSHNDERLRWAKERPQRMTTEVVSEIPWSWREFLRCSDQIPMALTGIGCVSNVGCTR